MAQLPSHGRELRLIMMVCNCGLVLEWNCRDLFSDGQVYGALWFWRNPEPRNWVVFKLKGAPEYASLSYEQGRKYSRVVGWRISGPMVRFTGAN